MFFHFQPPQFGQHSKLPENYKCKLMQFVPDSEYIPVNHIPVHIDKFQMEPPMLLDINANGMVIGIRIPVNSDKMADFQISEIPAQFWNLTNLDAQTLAKSIITKESPHDLSWDAITKLTSYGKKSKIGMEGLSPLPGANEE